MQEDNNTTREASKTLEQEIEEILGDFFKEFGDKPSLVDEAIKAGCPVITDKDHHEHVIERVMAMV